VTGELEGSPASADSVADDPRMLARDGLVNLGYGAAEAEHLLDGATGESAEDLIAAALRRAAEGVWS
jgi:Holliday junction resolvasome RuvABC DNA-binding subunit